MDKFLIVVPSKGRAEQIVDKTIRYLRHSKYPYRVFIEANEVDSYSKYLGEYEYFVIDEHNLGLGYTKSRIMRYLEINSIDYVFKQDDDIARWRGLKNRGLGKAIYKYSVEDYAKIHDDLIESSLDILRNKEEVGGIGLPYGGEMRQVALWTHINARLQTAYIVKTKYFHKELYNNIKYFEDFLVFLDIIADNKTTLRYGLTGIDCETVGSNKGGIQLFNRNPENILKELQYIQTIYPYLKIRAVNKPWGYEPDLRSLPVKSMKLV